MPHPDYLEKILTARVYDVAIESPLEIAPALSRRFGNRVYLKREDMQPVFSFKVRGAYNKMAQLSSAQLARGVICASAGNHAQGVAMAAQKLGCTAVIVMPATTPAIKINGVKARGGQVVLFGDNFDAANAHALAMAAESGAVFIPPYDDPDVIAGQGTVGMEILRQLPEPYAIFIPIGGGGLAAGIAAYVKRLKPHIKIIGVEPVDAACMHAAIAAGERVRLPQVGIFADGVAVRLAGEETFRLCKALVDEIILIDTDGMCAAIKDVFEDTRSILEPAGALAIAGLKAYVERTGIQGHDLVAIASGANMNFDRLRHVAERSEVGEAREAVMAVTIAEHPGSFMAFCKLIGNRSITEFNYRYADPKQAHIFVGIQVSNRLEAAALAEQLQAAGNATLDLTDNELAKVHLRHLVGGRAPQVGDERLLRFEFPERPGALMRFLESMSAGWNISLFHYRNHGADFGRVLVGMQVPGTDQAAFQDFLDQLGYAYVDETHNAAAHLFLA